MTLPTARMLPWDSQHFGLKIGQVTVDDLSERAPLGDWIYKHEIDCVYLRAPASGPAVAKAESFGFRFQGIHLDYRIHLGKEEPDAAFGTGVRLEEANLQDAQFFAQTAASDFTESRFFVDRRFPQDRSRKLFEEWLVQAVHGMFDDVMLVIHTTSIRRAGFVTLRCTEQGARIGLLCVHADARGAGIGRQLVRAAKNWTLQQYRAATTKEYELFVATQGSNLAASRLYAGEGGVLVEASVNLHWWPKADRW